MSFLPGSLTPALLRSYHRKVVSPFRRSFNFKDVLSLWLNLGKQKEPITQSIRNRREHGSRFKVMFYVIGSENSKSGSAFYSSRQQNQRRGGAVRHFRCTDTVSDEPTYGGTLVFSCTTIIQIHHLSVKFLNVSHYIRNFKEQFSTGEKKIPLLVRTFRSDLSTGFGKDFEIFLKKLF